MFKLVIRRICEESHMMLGPAGTLLMSKNPCNIDLIITKWWTQFDNVVILGHSLDIENGIRRKCLLLIRTLCHMQQLERPLLTATL